MVIEVREGSVQGRILRLLLEVYPISIEDIEKELNAPKGVVEREINKLVSRGIVSLDVLPDKRYIRLLRRDISFFGLKESQKKTLKRKGRKRGETKDYDGMMYG